MPKARDGALWRYMPPHAYYVFATMMATPSCRRFMLQRCCIRDYFFRHFDIIAGDYYMRAGAMLLTMLICLRLRHAA